MSEGKEGVPEIEFKIENLVEAPAEVVEAAQKGISMVWEKNVGEPASMSLVIVSRIVDKRGRNTGKSAEYDPETDTFMFAVDKIKERMSFGLSEDQTMLIVAAHEATHKVQCYRGNCPRPFPQNPLMAKLYLRGKHEREAWEEALHVFKKVYPNSHGGFNTGGIRYEVPEKSKYP